MEYTLEKMNAENILVVVTRWFGGVMLGADRFRDICHVTKVIVEQHQQGKFK
jgi:putative IMPACT (imprinted ancient) family translation regulator